MMIYKIKNNLTEQIFDTKKMKYALTLIIMLIYISIFSQDINTHKLDEILKKGKLFTKPLKNGEIEFLKNSNPPKDTWLYSKLEDYKKNLGSNEILYGSIIMPSVDKTIYSYNLFAYNTKQKKYYFVAIVSYQILEKDVKFKNTYLFTEKKSLKGWWKSVFVFYQNKKTNDILNKYIFKVCPPPPI